MRRLLLLILMCWPLLFSGTICNVVVGQPYAPLECPESDTAPFSTSFNEDGIVDESAPCMTLFATRGTAGSHDAGDYYHVLSNKLSCHGGGSSESQYNYPTKKYLALAADRRIDVTLDSFTQTANYVYLRVYLWASGSNSYNTSQMSAPQNAIMIQVVGTTSGAITLQCFSYNASGSAVQVGSSVSSITNGSHIFSIVFVDTTHVKVQVDGSDVISSSTFTSTIADNIYGCVSGYHVNSGGGSFAISKVEFK